MARPLALTVGEPAGIGPDITFAAWRQRAELGLPPFYLLGDPAFVTRRAERIAPDLTVAVVEPAAAWTTFETALPVVDIGVSISAEPGRPDESSAPAALAAIRRAVADARLNPHAGEDGALGDEDLTVVRPAVERLKAEGIEARGPLPADSLFHRAARASYDAALAMYHDQALIPIKTLAFDHAVNVTLGLPFVRTSPDHGTAFDIAGTGRADPTSLIAALQLAARLSSRAQSPPIARRA